MLALLRNARWWRVLAVSLLVPVVVLGSTSAVRAEPVGPWKGITIEMDVHFSFDYVQRDCRFNVRHATTTIDIGTDGRCLGLPDSSVGSLQPAEAGSSYTLTFDGQSGNSDSCGATAAGTLGQHALNGTVRVAGSIPSTTSTLTGGSDPTDCTITKICVRLMNSNFECVDVTIPPPEDEEEEMECTNGTVGRPILTKKPFEYVDTVGGNPRYRWDWELKTQLGVSGTADTTSGGGWVVYSIHHEKGIGNVTTLWSGPDTSYAGRRAARLVPLPPNSATIDTFVFPQLGPTYETDLLQKSGEIQPIGVGVFWATQSSTGSYMFTSHSGLARLGLTWPADCAYYWGARIRKPDDPNKPGGENPVDTEIPTAGEDPTLEPPIDDDGPIEEPDTDLGWLAAIWAAIQALIGVVRSVVSAIAGLAAAIVRGVGDLLEELFVPDQDSWGVDELVSQMEAKPPFSVLSGLEDEARSLGQAYASGGSCGTIADFGNGGVLNCATIAGVPGFSGLYALVSAGFMGLTGWSCFLMVSRLFEQGQ